MTARKPYTVRDRRRLTGPAYGHRPRCNWGEGDLPAPFAVGDVIDVHQQITENAWSDTPDVWPPGPYIVVAVDSVDEGDGWTVRLTDGHDPRIVTHRLRIRGLQSAAVIRGLDPVDHVGPCTVVETADPDGLALRERMLAGPEKGESPASAGDSRPARALSKQATHRRAGAAMVATPAVGGWTLPAQDVCPTCGRAM